MTKICKILCNGCNKKLGLNDNILVQRKGTSKNIYCLDCTQQFIDIHRSVVNEWDVKLRSVEVEE